MSTKSWELQYAEVLPVELSRGLVGSLWRALVAAAVCVSMVALTVAYARLAPVPAWSSPAANGQAAECYRPLASRTTGVSNRPYAIALAEAEKTGRSAHCFIANSGRCGELHFVSIGNGFVLEKEYFAGEKLVALRAFTDDLGANRECLGGPTTVNASRAKIRSWRRIAGGRTSD